MSIAAVPPEQVIRLRSISNSSEDLDVGELLGEARQVLPMQRDPVTGEQAGPGQNVRARVEAAQDRALPVQPAQPVE